MTFLYTLFYTIAFIISRILLVFIFLVQYLFFG